MHIEVQIVNAFIDGARGGNPAGVVVDANGLTAAQKQHIAKVVGKSETAFVSASNSATFKLEFFTPNRQIAHCGHATIATFSLLRQTGVLGDGHFSKETIEGNRAIIIEDGMAFMEQLAPKYKPLPAGSDPRIRALNSLGLTDADLVDPGPYVVNTGNSFLLVPVRDADTLKRITPHLDAINHMSENLDLIGYYVFSRETRQPERAAGTRMFAPRYGIAEEAGTGMAAGPLACFLHDQMGAGETRVFIEQGYLMTPPSPSVICVDLKVQDGKITGLMAGGTAKRMSNLIVEV